MFQPKHKFAKVCLFQYSVCQQEMNINISFNLIVETGNAAISEIARKKLQREQFLLSILHKLSENWPYQWSNWKLKLVVEKRSILLARI